MNIPVFWFVFAGLSVLYLFLGIYASYKVETIEDYFLAGRTLGVWPLTATLIATHVGGGMLLGSAQESYASGYIFNSGILYPLGLSIGFLLLGSWFAGRLRAYNIATITTLYEVRFGSPLLRKCASLLWILSLTGILSAIVISSRTLMVSLGVYHELLFLLFWLFVIVYTMMGGLRAVVLTDVYQVLFMISIFTGIFIYVLFKDGNTVFSLPFFGQTSSSVRSLNWTGFFLMPILYTLVEQDIAQRFFAAKNKRVAGTSAFLASLAILVFTCIPIYCGVKAKMSGLTVPQGANALIVFIASYTNDFVVAVVACALFAAIISTGDSLLCAMSSLVAQDFGASWSIRSTLWYSRGITLGMGLLALALAYSYEGILEVMTQSYELTISCLFVSLIIAVCSDKYADTSAATASIVAGLISFFVFRVCSLGVPREIASLTVSAFFYCVVWVYNTRQNKVKTV